MWSGREVVADALVGVFLALVFWFRHSTALSIYEACRGVSCRVVRLRAAWGLYLLLCVCWVVRGIRVVGFDGVRVISSGYYLGASQNTPEPTKIERDFGPRCLGSLNK